MKRILLAAASLACGVLGSTMGCDEGLDAVVAAPDGGSPSDASLDGARDGGSGDGSSDAGQVDAASDAGPDAAGGRPPWLLVSVNYQGQSELVAYSLTAKDVDGRFDYPGSIGLTFVDTLGRPFLLEQSNDLVVELDPLAPWRPRASWDVRLDDRADGGAPNADPVMIAPVRPGKAYVVRFNRNHIAVIDDTVKADASAPTKTIDLSSFADPNDTDTSVDPVGAVFTGGKLYVLLGNLDLTRVSPTGFFTICTTAQPKLIAIDPTTDAVEAVIDGGAAGGTLLPGYNPNFNGLWLDAPRNRLLVLEGGCNPELADAGKGPLERRQVDAIDLTTGAVTTVLDLNGEGFPNAMARLSADEVIFGFDFFSAKRWLVTSNALGASLPDGLSAFTPDPNGNVFGIQSTFLGDGGTERNLIEVPSDGGAAQILAPLPVTQPGGFAGAIDYAPVP
jgi:hypothetical protein